ncbi:hypothetical protein MSAN_00116600 [Mycena sanguinolenta]|uniref:Uncharacterized protein n=1 Tax=Mycena sanguinolenta TaxID=230812 RepID=A0A8H6ZGI1_9AGAR|nr:hypothetical protein MSAN_00116600 [Mycena sanguinolenta]
MRCILFADSHSPRTYTIVQGVVHLLVSTTTSFITVLLVLNAASLHPPITSVFGVTLFFNILVFTLVEAFCSLGHVRSVDRSLTLDYTFFTPNAETMKEAEEGRRQVLTTDLI